MADYPCPVCDKRYRKALNRARHVATRHLLEMQTANYRWFQCPCQTPNHGFVHAPKGYRLFAEHLVKCEDLVAHLLAAVLGVGDA